jgi:hypothetical protein
MDWDQTILRSSALPDIRQEKKASTTLPGQPLGGWRTTRSMLSSTQRTEGEKKEIPLRTVAGGVIQKQIGSTKQGSSKVLPLHLR